ncbi:hypothetical protein FQZ97_849530 [compost metagenome]
MLVHHAQVHEVVRRQLVGLEVVAHDVQLRGRPHQFEHRLDELALREGFGHAQGLGETLGRGRQRHQA